MSRIRAFVNPKFVVATLVMLASGAIYIASLPKTDAVSVGVCTYYSSTTYKTAVGARGTGCCGSVINWGVTSAFKKCDTLNCTDQVCPN